MSGTAETAKNKASCCPSVREDQCGGDGGEQFDDFLQTHLNLPRYDRRHVDGAWLTNDEANHRIALLRLPGTKVPVDKPHTAGLHHNRQHD